MERESLDAGVHRISIGLKKATVAASGKACTAVEYGRLYRQIRPALDPT